MLAGAATGFYESVPIFTSGQFGYEVSKPIPAQMNITQSVTLICC